MTILTPFFWDCECDSEFIHCDMESYCPLCGAIQEEQPESRATELSEEAISPRSFYMMRRRVAENVDRLPFHILLSVCYPDFLEHEHTQYSS